jgi:hypothetical protein
LAAFVGAGVLAGLALLAGVLAAALPVAFAGDLAADVAADLAADLGVAGAFLARGAPADSGRSEGDEARGVTAAS